MTKFFDRAKELRKLEIEAENERFNKPKREAAELKAQTLDALREEFSEDNRKSSEKQEALAAQQARRRANQEEQILWDREQARLNSVH